MSTPPGEGRRMAPRLKQIGDSSWPEVFLVYNYAVFMGYLYLAVTGLGYLVIQWTTVVLLGGFVSVLPKKDFWSLTVIMLVETASAVDGILGDARQSTLRGLEVSVFTNLYQTFDLNKTPSFGRIGLVFCRWLLELLPLFIIVLGPLAVILKVGHYISAVLSLWRLIEQDYANTDGGPNLKPALDILYSLAVAQGVLYGYRSIRALKLKTGKLAERVARFCTTDLDIVWEYLRDIEAGCMKGQSFPKGRNLVTYAMDLMMESKSPDKYISGVRILGKFLGNEGMPDRHLMIKQLLTGSTSFTYMIQKLLETLGPRSPYSHGIKEHAGRIVAHVAGDIRLEQFPRGLQCISSLLDTFEEYSWKPEEDERDRWLPKEYERDWLLEKYEVKFYEREKSKPTASTPPESNGDLLRGHNGMVIQGMRILQKLAIDEDNCSLIISTQNLVSKTMAHLTSDQLHRRDDYHDEWSSMAEESLELMSRLMAAPGETGMKLCREISRDTKAVISLHTILECCKCDVLLKRKSAGILLDLSTFDTSSSRAIISGSSSTIFMWMLLHIVLLADNCFRKMPGSTIWMRKISHIRKLAGGKLQAMLCLQGERNVTTMLESAIDGLTRTIVAAPNTTNRVNAAKILEHICLHYANDGVYIKELKKATSNVMPQILKEILGSQSISKEIKAVKEESSIQFTALGTDIERGDSSQDICLEKTFSSHLKKSDEHEDENLQAALIYLCKAVWERWLNKDPDLARHFDDIAAKVCSEQGKPINTFDSLWSLKYIVIETGRCLKMSPFGKEKRAQDIAIEPASSSRQGLSSKIQCMNCFSEDCVCHEDSQHLLHGHE